MTFANRCIFSIDPARVLGLPISRMQRIRRPRYVLRTCAAALLIVALPHQRWCSALAYHRLHQLHRLPAGRTAHHGGQGWQRWSGRRRHQAYASRRHELRTHLREQAAVAQSEESVIADFHKTFG
jgi:hypothetical protein